MHFDTKIFGVEKKYSWHSGVIRKKQRANLNAWTDLTVFWPMASIMACKMHTGWLQVWTTLLLVFLDIPNWISIGLVFGNCSCGWSPLSVCLDILRLFYFQPLHFQPLLNASMASSALYTKRPGASVLSVYFNCDISFNQHKPLAAVILLSLTITGFSLSLKVAFWPPFLASVTGGIVFYLRSSILTIYLLCMSAGW